MCDRQDEIHQIVEKRRAFEYMMKRIPLRKIDALRYIEYELNLDALRQKRKERSGLEKTTLGDTAGIKRVHSIFDRVIYKHRGSVELWLQYIAFCKAERSGRVLSHVFSRALQSHPRSPELWIEAASYEFSTNLNIESARVLMQRAIRINKGCQRLWHEYFRLELLYIQKLTCVLHLMSADLVVNTGACADLATHSSALTVCCCHDAASVVRSSSSTTTTANRWTPVRVCCSRSSRRRSSSLTAAAATTRRAWQRRPRSRKRAR